MKIKNAQQITLVLLHVLIALGVVILVIQKFN